MQQSHDPFSLRVQTPATSGMMGSVHGPFSSSSHFPTDDASHSTSTSTSTSISPKQRGGFSPTTSALLSQFQVQSNPKSISPSPFNTAKLTLNTSHDSSPPPFSSFNPYFISPSNRCKSPSVTLNPAFTFASAAAAYCPSPSMSHSPRMGIKEANDVWEAQWSPFGRSKTNPAPSPANRPSPHSSSSPVPPRPSSKFHWTYEEGGHERDKGDDSTSEEEEEEERKEVEAPPKPFDFEFDPFAPSSSSTSAPSPRSSLLTTATKYATPHAGHPVLSALTPKTRRPTQSSPVTIFPAPPPPFPPPPPPSPSSPSPPSPPPPPRPPTPPPSPPPSTPPTASPPRTPHPKWPPPPPPPSPPLAPPLPPSQPPPS